MTPLAARMDFELESMSADFAERVEELANAEIALAREIGHPLPAAATRRWRTRT